LANVRHATHELGQREPGADLDQATQHAIISRRRNSVKERLIRIAVEVSGHEMYNKRYWLLKS
jgi:hypothetical protein